MKNLNPLQLLVVGVIIISVTACTPKYGAHFTATDNFYQPEPTPEVVGEIFSDLDKTSELQDETLTASKAPVHIIPNPSIEKLVKKHEQQIRAIEEKGLTAKDLSREIRKEQQRNRRELIREMKHEIKEIKEVETPHDDEYVLMMILAVLLPPLAVGLTYGITDKFWISVLLTLLFYIPGIVYALIVVSDYYR